MIAVLKWKYLIAGGIPNVITEKINGMKHSSHNKMPLSPSM